MRNIFNLKSSRNWLHEEIVIKAKNVFGAKINFFQISNALSYFRYIQKEFLIWHNRYSRPLVWLIHSKKSSFKIIQIYLRTHYRIYIKYNFLSGSFFRHPDHGDNRTQYFRSNVSWHASLSIGILIHINMRIASCTHIIIRIIPTKWYKLRERRIQVFWRMRHCESDSILIRISFDDFRT